MTDGDDTTRERAAQMTARVHGRVQGVGFRWFVYHVARDLGLAGRATNRSDGGVEVVAEGPHDSCQKLLDILGGGGTPGRIERVTVEWSEPTGMRGFTTD